MTAGSPCWDSSSHPAPHTAFSSTSALSLLAGCWFCCIPGPQEGASDEQLCSRGGELGFGCAPFGAGCAEHNHSGNPRQMQTPELPSPVPFRMCIPKQPFFWAGCVLRTQSRGEPGRCCQSWYLAMLHSGSMCCTLGSSMYSNSKVLSS